MKFFLLFLFLISYSLFSQDLNLGSEDFFIEESAVDGGYFLKIRQKDGVSSVMLVESTEDKEFVSATYAYRAKEYNKTNGDEKRILNGSFLDGPNNRYYLIDSTVEKFDNKNYFNIFIPYTLYYGFSYTRNGTVDVKDGTYFSVRTFSKPYGDYSGKFKDNPFILRIEEQISKPAGLNYPKEIESSFDCLSTKVLKSKPNSATKSIKEAISDLAQNDNQSIDISLVLDTTGSMEKVFDNLKKNLVDDIYKTFSKNKININFVFFKDYGERYLYNITSFTSNKKEIQSYLDSEYVEGGGDFPEAINEAIFASLTRSNWSSNSKLIIVLTDSMPHPIPRGTVTKDMVYKKSIEQNIPIQTILFPV